jgi:hypothetical protein
MMLYCAYCKEPFEYIKPIRGGRRPKYCDNHKQGRPKNTLKATGEQILDFLLLPSSGILHYPSGTFVAILKENRVSSFDVCYAISKVKEIQDSAS